jgi:hypothetical protein
MSIGIFAWDSLESNLEVMEELLRGFRTLNTRELSEYLISVIVCEQGLSLREIKNFRDKVIDLNGDPLEYIDEDTGEISLDAI